MCWRNILERLAAGSTHLCLDSSRVDADHLDVLISQSLHGAAQSILSSSTSGCLSQAGREQATLQQSSYIQAISCLTKLRCQAAYIVCAQGPAAEAPL